MFYNGFFKSKNLEIYIFSSFGFVMESTEKIKVGKDEKCYQRMNEYFLTFFHTEGETVTT